MFWYKYMYKFRILLIAFRWPYCVTTEVQHLHMYLFELFILLPHPLPTVSSVHELASLRQSPKVNANACNEYRNYTQETTVIHKIFIK